jgi:hypothetical protein
VGFMRQLYQYLPSYANIYIKPNVPDHRERPHAAFHVQQEPQPNFPTFLGTVIGYDCPLPLSGRFASRSLPDTLSAPSVCVPYGSVVVGSSPPPLGLLVNRYPCSSGSTSKETAGSPKFPSFPSDDMLRSPQTPVVSCCLALTPAGLLPSTRARVSAFSLASTGIILWTTTLLISELHDAAYRLATPGSVQPLTELHAGSLLSGWLGVAQVGLESSDSHPLGNSDLFPDVFLHSLDLGLRLARGAAG